MQAADEMLDTILHSPVWQELLHSNGDTVHSDERHCGLQTYSDVWTWSLVWLVFLLLF